MLETAHAPFQDFVFVGRDALMPWTEIAWRLSLLIQTIRQLGHEPGWTLPYAGLALFAVASLLLVVELSLMMS